MKKFVMFTLGVVAIVGIVMGVRYKMNESQLETDSDDVDSDDVLNGD